MSAVDELRATRARIRLLQDEMTSLNERVKTHPAKPQHFEQTIEMMAAWDKVKAPFIQRRAEIKAELAPLNEKVKEIQKSLNQAPVSRVTLGKILDRLTDLEAVFASKGHAQAWDDLTSFIDYLEYEENRLAVEEQVAKLEAAS